MRHFATESGKSKRQFYTPAEIARDNTPANRQVITGRTRLPQGVVTEE